MINKNKYFSILSIILLIISLSPFTFAQEDIDLTVSSIYFTPPNPDSQDEVLTHILLENIGSNPFWEDCYYRVLIDGNIFWESNINETLNTEIVLGNKFPKCVLDRPRTYKTIDNERPAVFGQ